HPASAGSAPAAACACADDPQCQVDGANCSSGGTAVLTCQTDGAGCHFIASAVTCNSPEICSGSPGSAQCVCPTIPGTGVNQSCTTQNATECDPATGNV